MSMNEHPYDSLPAFALGALDTDEASRVIHHVAACQACREDVEAWSAVVAMLPYLPAPRDPPAHVKHRLFAMIATASGEQPSAPARPAHRSGAQRWMSVLAASSLALALVFGLLFADARRNAGELTAQVEDARRNAGKLTTQIELSNKAIQQLTVELGQARQGIEFIAYRTAVDQPLVDGQAQAEGKMFMKVGDRHAVLVVRGLQQSEPGKVYKFWFATPTAQVPSSTFTVGPDGIAAVALEAPQAVNTYAQVMVTVETNPDSPTPSDNVVLQAELHT
jgi:anti-sigma factor RsiW